MAELINPTSVPHEKGEEAELAMCLLHAAWAGKTPEYSARGTKEVTRLAHRFQAAEKLQGANFQRLLTMFNAICTLPASLTILSMHIY